MPNLVPHLSPAEQLSAIRLTLRRVRRSWLRQRLLLTLQAAGTVGAATLVVTVIIRRLAMDSPGVERSDLLMALMLCAATVAIGTLLTFVRAPSLARVARWTDDRLHLHDRLITAVRLEEVSPDPDRSAIARALVADAYRYAQSIERNALFPARWPRWSLAAPALVGLAIAIPLLPTATPVDTGQPIATQSFDAASNAAALRRVSEALSRTTEDAEDRYLHAVADAFMELAERLDADAVDARTFGAEVERLLEHLTATVEGREDMLGERIAALLSRGAQDEVDAAGAFVPVDRELAEDAPGSDEAVDVSATSRDVSALLDRLVEELATAAVEAESAQVERGVGTDERRAPDDDYTVDLGVRPPSGQSVDADARGTPAGAAMDADESPGDAAGAGAQPDEVAVPETSFVGIDLEEDAVALPWSEAEDGTRVDRDVLPQARGNGSPTGSGLTATPHHRVAEASTGHETISGRYRRTVLQYFLPSGNATLPGGP